MTAKLVNIVYLLFIIVITSCGSSVTEGYTDKVSYSNGESVHVFLNSESSKDDYAIEVTNLEGEVMKEFNVKLSPQSINSKPYENGFGFSETFSFELEDYPSGVYLIDEQIPFIVKPDTPKKITILYSSNTENAYAGSGGKSLYDYNSSNNEPAEIVSFLRPIKLANNSDEFLKWIASENYEMGYICDMDMDDYSNIDGVNLLIIPGHSEYWTREARLNFDRFIDNGGHALILSGNTMWWQVRYSEDKTQMIGYKDFKNDSLVPDTLKSMVWSYGKLKFPIINSIGVDFEHGGFGLNDDKGWDGFKIVNESSPLLLGTGLKNGEIISLPTDEYDGAELSFKNGNVELVNTPEFYKYELVGYDLASRKKGSNGVWIVMQKSQDSGLIINIASTSWCDEEGMNGDDGDLVKQVTLNAINTLIEGESPFSNK